MDSILTSIKKLLGIQEDYTQFDPDIVIHINTAINVLDQLGVVKANGLFITDKSTTWDDLIEEGSNYDLVKTYIYLRVRMLFDPPTGAVSESYKETIKELEWRLTVRRDQDE